MNDDPKFISHVDLDYNANGNIQYLKDDTPVFRVSVQMYPTTIAMAGDSLKTSPLETTV